MTPSTIPFSKFEIAIFVFFLGRITMEVNQIVSVLVRVKTERKVEVQKSKHHILTETLNMYSRNGNWNIFDLVANAIAVSVLALRLVSQQSAYGYQIRIISVANYLYGLNTMCLTIRFFGSILESRRNIGVMQIALTKIISKTIVLFWQFLVAVLAFSFAITKVFMVGRLYDIPGEKSEQVCKNPGISCWLELVNFLTWSLMGVADTDKLSSEDDVSDFVVWVLYAIFLIAGAIVLVNLMIALLSNAFHGVESNSVPEWCFKKAVIYQTYRDYHCIPVPLNLLSVPCMALKALFRYCHNSGNNHEGSQAKNDIRELISKLDVIYISKYGYLFPSTGIQGVGYSAHKSNQEMISLITQQMFLDGHYLGTEDWSGEGIKIDENMLEYDVPRSCSICQKGNTQPHHIVRYRTALLPDSPMFKVLITNCGKRRSLAVGVVSLSESDLSDVHVLPGWFERSVGYHLGYGSIYEKNNRHYGRELKDAMAYSGDIVCCKVLFENRGDEDTQVVVRFSLNGQEVGRTTVEYDGRADTLYPCIGMGYEGMSVQVIPMKKINHTPPRSFEEIRMTSNDAIQELKSQVNKMNVILAKLEDKMQRELQDTRRPVSADACV